MTIFKAYDVRGIYPTEINERAVYEIGRRLKILKIKKIAVAKDARLSSDTLSNSLIEGILDSGIDVYDIGLASSPILSHFSAKYKMFGAMITASHNPREYNGVKLVDKNAVQISYEDGLKLIEKSMTKKTPKKEKLIKRGKLIHKRILNEYADYLEEKFKKYLKKDVAGRKTLKVVFDCSNGVGGLALFMLTRLNIEPVIINEHPDGKFPNHPCDQTKKENLAQLQSSVLKNKADFGVMFDGDADRCAFVDERGQIVRLDLAFIILALDAIKKYGNKKLKPKVLYDLRFSKAAEEEVKKAKGIPIMMRVGNPFYKKKMHKDKTAIIAGELSGHIMFADNYGIDDPLYATLKLAAILSNSKITLSERIKSHTKYYSSGEINYHLDNKSAQDSIIKKITESYQEKKQLHIDGISIIDKDWWMNIRASNTEPVLRLIIEGISKSVVESQKKVIDYLINQNN